MQIRLQNVFGAAIMAALGCGSGNGPSSAATGTGGATSTSTSSGSTSSSSGSSGTGGSLADGGDGADGGASDCVGFKYCDDFEAYPAVTTVTNGAALGPWKASVAGVTMTVDSVKPYGGTRSLHIVVAAGAAAHGTLNHAPAAGLVPGNDLFGRAMLFYSSTGGNGLPLAVHSWIFNSDGNSATADGGVTMNLGGGGAELQINYHPPAPLPEASVVGGVMTAGVWHCVQWQYDGAGTPVADDAKVWVDGKLAVEALPAKGWNFAAPWSSFDFGFTHYQTLAAGVEVFLDDFALDGTMVPCPP